MLYFSSSSAEKNASGEACVSITSAGCVISLSKSSIIDLDMSALICVVPHRGKIGKFSLSFFSKAGEVGEPG